VRVLVVLWAAGAVRGQGVAAALVQAETDEYPRYELLPPESASFAFLSEVTATMLAIIRKRSVLDFGRTGVVDDTAQLEA